jgi:hypothetical protein
MSAEHLPPSDDAIPLIPPSPRLPTVTSGASSSGPVNPTAEAYGEDASRPFVRSVPRMIRDYFLGEDPTFGAAMFPLCILSAVLFTRHPLKTNFIFDEQEALLANPYVRSVVDHSSKLHWLDAFRRDFWGLPADRSIGSYRPIPNLVWRALWALGFREQTPFLHHWVNVILHGFNAALLTVIVFKVTKDRALSWLTGTIFVMCAVLTEAVSGVVGIADVLGALGVLMAGMALGLSAYFMFPAVFLATLFGLFSKESALCAVPLIPFAAWMTSRYLHPENPRGFLRMLLALVATSAAFVLYVESRRRLFPAPLPADLTVEANAHKGLLGRTFATLLRWYAQPILPRDPLNNPLVEAQPLYRVAGGLRVYARGIYQIVFPQTLSGDYSAPQEPIPDRLVFPESVIGALAMALPLLVGPILGLIAWRRRKPGLMALIGVAMVWIVISYFPVSNIPVLLPTVRAERFWYFPALGTSVILAAIFVALTRKLGHLWIGVSMVTLFLGFQAVAARLHANDYTDDLVFWDATRRAVPRSAKAHLNYSVMQGARGNLEERRRANETALSLAPKWPMANVYLGDTLCRLHRADESWPHYKNGFELAPNDQNLVALGVQCLWDEKKLGTDSPVRTDLEALAAKHPGTWVAYLARDTIDNGESHNGVDPQYRPRGYNEGPKQDKQEEKKE